LDGIKSWSLQAVDTCPGSKDENGGLVPACQGCYATTGCYVFKTTKAPRLFNQEDWKRPEWVSDMVEALKKEKFFRWFDSGDMYSIKLANKMLEVMQRTPHVKHWLPTRMAKFTKFHSVINAMNSLSNVVVRFSSDSIVGEYDARHGSVIVPTLAEVTEGMSACLAYENAGKCSGCRKCYDKDVPVIAYVQHGKKMAKVFKLMSV
jgi:hypothetical protein